ncbi:MAG: sigma 54-interacting transcriptional regulator [Kofleriaceae bacterium]
MASAVDHRTTRRRPPAAAGPSGALPPLVATVLWHAHAERVGELALLDDVSRISRVEPAFAAPHGGEKRPLGDVHLSRRPMLELSVIAGGLRLTRLAPGELRLDGASSQGERVELGDAALAEGVVLELEERVALLVHRRPRPRAGPALGLLGGSAAIDGVRAEVCTLAPLTSAVLVRGETGTGKELVAAALHQASARRAGPFVAVNLAALPSAVAAAALFGHRKGAFTGAVEGNPGYFRQAAGGTLFLDEIGAAPLDVQAMLLRALEQSEIQPVGAPTPEAVDVRILAATDADLEAAVAGGAFREALLHRLGAATLRVPPLRARRDDIARLLLAFVREELAARGAEERLAPRAAEDAPWLSARFVAAACRAPWSGNVRALRNLCRRMAARYADVDVVPDDAGARELAAAGAAPASPASVEGARPAPRAEARLTDAEILQALEEHGWQVGRAAAALGLARNTVYAAMERAGHGAARALDRAQIVAAVDAAAGELARAARALRVSERALKLRMRELDL